MQRGARPPRARPRGLNCPRALITARLALAGWGRVAATPLPAPHHAQTGSHVPLARRVADASAVHEGCALAGLLLLVGRLVGMVVVAPRVRAWQHWQWRCPRLAPLDPTGPDAPDPLCEASSPQHPTLGLGPRGLARLLHGLRSRNDFISLAETFRGVSGPYLSAITASRSGAERGGVGRGPNDRGMYWVLDRPAGRAGAGMAGGPARPDPALPRSSPRTLRIPPLNCVS